MTEYNEIMYCPNCKSRQAFLLSGSATKAMCPVCGEVIEGITKIRIMKEAGLREYQLEKETEKVQEVMNYMFDELNKIYS